MKWNDWKRDLNILQDILQYLCIGRFSIFASQDCLSSKKNAVFCLYFFSEPANINGALKMRFSKNTLNISRFKITWTFLLISPSNKHLIADFSCYIFLNCSLYSVHRLAYMYKSICTVYIGWHICIKVYVQCT